MTEAAAASFAPRSKPASLWGRYGNAAQWFFIALMVIAAGLRLTMESRRLLVDSVPFSAIDLRMRYDEVCAWFAGQPVYTRWIDANYPPATYAVLWPIGRVSLTTTRQLWAVTSYLAIVCLGFLSLRIGGGEGIRLSAPQRILLFLIPCAMYGTAITVGNGQLIVHLLPALLGGLMLVTGAPSIWRDVLASALITIALAKVTIALPFMWILVFVARSPRPLIFIPVMYLLLTAVALQFQDAPVMTLFRQWFANAGVVHGGYGDINCWLRIIGLGRISSIASALTGLLFGIWVWKYRRVDVWILIGVSALVARMWTYHRLYDDLLVLPALLALFRLARRDGDILAGVVFFFALCLSMGIATPLNNEGTLGNLFRLAQTLGWLSMLYVLIVRAWQQRPAAMPAVDCVTKGSTT